MSTRKISPRLQQYLAQLDRLQNTYVAILSQKQNVDSQLIEVKNALSEIEKTTEEQDVYKLVGNILVKVDKERIKNELSELKTLLETRQKTLENEVKRLSSEIEKLNEVVTKMLKEEGLVT